MVSTSRDLFFVLVDIFFRSDTFTHFAEEPFSGEISACFPFIVVIMLGVMNGVRFPGLFLLISICLSSGTSDRIPAGIFCGISAGICGGGAACSSFARILPGICGLPHYLWKILIDCLVLMFLLVLCRYK